MAVIIKTNTSQLSDVEIPDLGITVPSLGGTYSITEIEELVILRESQDIALLLSDDAFGLGSSTLILNDGVDDVGQDNISAFFGVVLLASTGPYSALFRDKDGNDPPVGSLPDADNAGQVLISLDGATFEKADPIVANGGWLVNDHGQLLVK